ncbi:hypothetical protein CERSUDRAFT_46554 [Gelatoporia subvermispora B]|uniref:Enoyl reductase (ER) domain-containing protein n=1 Tax=Ceriporiopsis subvermispora (strain B) TaxID=914234 RepID=M2QSZ4_CERS8|nr:hypothetical protein CERSUDRAFT_46554 [Gelatoporia subvermispora B]
MPSQQKALILRSKQGEFALEDIPVPAPGPHQILVKVEAAALNPLDWKIQAFGVMRETYPAILGFDGAGVVEAVGAEVQDLVKGDRILFQGGHDNNSSTFQQYVLLPAGVSAKVFPSTVTYDEAASIPVGLSAAALGLFSHYAPSGSAKLYPPWEEGGRGKYVNQPIVILGGASSVGHYGTPVVSSIQLAELAGFSPIITTASPRNADLLKSLGATHVLDRSLTADALGVEVAKITSQPFEVVFDAVGLPATQNSAFDILAQEGQLVTVRQDAVGEAKKAVHPGKRVIQVYGSLAVPYHHKAAASLCAALSSLLEEGAIKPMRVEVLPGGLAGIVSGLERLKDNQVSAAKLVVRPHETR